MLGFPVPRVVGVHGGCPHVAVMVEGRRRRVVAIDLRGAHGPAPHARPWSPACTTCSAARLCLRGRVFQGCESFGPLVLTLP